MQYYDNFKRTTLKEGPPKLTWYIALLWKPLVGDLHTCKWTRGAYYAKYVTLNLRYNKHKQKTLTFTKNEPTRFLYITKEWGLICGITYRLINKDINGRGCVAIFNNGYVADNWITYIYIYIKNMKCMRYREQEILLFLLFSLSLLAVTVSERDGSVSVSERPFGPFRSRRSFQSIWSCKYEMVRVREFVWWGF